MPARTSDGSNAGESNRPARGTRSAGVGKGEQQNRLTRTAAVLPDSSNRYQDGPTETYRCRRGYAAGSDKLKLRRHRCQVLIGQEYAATPES